MKRLVILSYDASKEFKEEYKKTNGVEFEEHMIWEAIESSGLGHLVGKPVESTLLIETDDYLYRYNEIINLLAGQFPGLYMVSALIHQAVCINFVDTRASSPESEKGLKDFLAKRKPQEEGEPRSYTFKPRK